MKLYNDLAEYYYEIEKPGRRFQDEIIFLDAVFKKYKIHSILDLGCGTGEHVIALQQLGYQSVGVDSSEKMISVAKKRFPEGSFENGDMQSFRKSPHVDALVCLFGTFNYLLTEEEIGECLKSFRANLKPAGLVILEVWNSYPVQRIKRKPISPVSLTRIGEILIKRNRGFKVTTTPVLDGTGESLVEVNFIFNLDEKIIKDRHMMRVFSFEEIKGFLEKNKFEILNVFGNHKMQKFNNISGRMLLVCKKKS